jgi:hypothetical protein
MWIAIATTAFAECPYVDPWPSFGDAVPKARTVVVGEVTDSLGDDPPGFAVWFRLRVEQVIRGRSDQVVTFQGLHPGGELKCPDGALLRPHVGDVIAISSDGSLPSVENGYALDSEKPLPFVAVVFISGQPARNFMPRIQTMTLRQVRALVLPATDTLDRVDVPPLGNSPFEPVALAATLLTAGIAAWRIDQRRARLPSNVE